MASEAISSAIMIIGAVLGAAVLVTAILPAIFSAGDTFGTVSSSAEQKLKTDFRIVNTYANDTAVQVWMKNVGSNRISIYDIEKSDVFLGIESQYDRYSNGDGTSGTFDYSLSGSDSAFWDIGETLETVIIVGTSPPDPIGDDVSISFTFALPNSIRRSTSFTKTYISP